MATLFLTICATAIKAVFRGDDASSELIRRATVSLAEVCPESGSFVLSCSAVFVNLTGETASATMLTAGTCPTTAGTKLVRTQFDASDTMVHIG